MIQKLYILLFILPFLTFVYSCSSSTSSRDIDDIPIKKLKEKVNKNSEQIQSLEAYGSISLDSPEFSNSGSIEIRIKRPDTVFIKIEGPFGIDIANALITRTNFIYYNVQDNKVILGKTNEINIGAILRIKISFDELINGFAGTFMLEDRPEDDLTASYENDLFLILQKQKSTISKFYIHPDYYFIKKYYISDENNNLLLEVNYSDYKLANNIYFPNEIKIKNPVTKQTVWLSYDEIEINKSNMSFKLKYPKSAKIINWE